MPTTKQPLIGIIGGKGKMGSLFADFFRQHSLEVIISDLGTPLSNQDVAFQADIVIVSVPITATVKTIHEISPYVKEDALLADLTSIKVDPIAAMLKSPAGVIGMHPMFGNTNPILGQTIILCPARPNKWSSWLKDFFITHGVKIEEMTASEHDQIMTVVQGFVHFADIAFAHTLKDLQIPIEKFLRFASPPSELKISFAARLLAQSPDLYGAIQIYNDQNIKTFQTYLKNITHLLAINETKHLESFRKYFQESANYLASYKNQALKETTWIIDQVIENRSINQLNQAPPAAPSSKKENHNKPSTKQIVTLGPRFTFSDMAATHYIQSHQLDQEIFYAKNLKQAIKFIANNDAKTAIIPIENSLHGTVRDTIDGLMKHDLVITNELILAINHCLASVIDSEIAQISMVVSHPQATNQCQNFISQNCPNAEEKATTSTAAGMELVRKNNNPHIAAIGSAYAAKHFGLKILAEDIADTKNNQTRFIVISKTAESNYQPDLPYKTSIIFNFTKDCSGNLIQILNEFAIRNINLTKIESRPSGKSMGDYVFYLEFASHNQETKTQEALAAIKPKVSQFKNLGSYQSKIINL